MAEDKTREVRFGYFTCAILWLLVIGLGGIASALRDIASNLENSCAIEAREAPGHGDSNG